MLRLLSFFITFFAIISTVSAQKLKKRTESIGIYKEVYHIDKKTKFRSGESYIENVKSGEKVAAGNYSNASRTGKWIFRDSESGEDYMIYNYTNDSLIYLNQSLVADSFLVKTDLGYELKKVDRPLLYIGLKDEIANLIGQDLEIPIEIIKNGRIGMSVLQYFVDDEGNLSGPRLVNGFSQEMEQGIHQKISVLSSKFLPAIIDGKTIASTFFVRVNVGLSNEAFATELLPPYILHIDVYYSIQPTVKRQPVRMEIRTVDFSEIE
ncbi:hypothetical protein [uncultured Draconibacterium sp.]|uniref:hypothetical protein n=1 Tax=uncultured Draconibacterium sp. TaxID=1573823 RepID=UPI002AA90AF6|nr:hypothetical protein [uncultured Draconibacterium sp.]